MLRYLVVICICTFPGLALAEELSLDRGASRSVSFHEDVVEVSLSKDKIIEVSVSPDKRRLRITGHNSGDVVMTVRMRSGDQINYVVEVRNTKAKNDLIPAALAALRDLGEFNLSVSGSGIVVSGRISSAEKGKEFAAIRERFPGIIVDKTEKPYQNPELIRKVVNRTLKEKSLTNYRIKNIGKILILEGTPRSEEEKELVLKVVRLIDPFIEDGMKDTQARLGDTVTIDLMFLEVNRKSDLTMGFAEGNTASRSQIGSFNYPERKFKLGNGPLTWTIAPFQAMLNLVQEELISRVLTNPKIIVRSGEKAEFHSGSELYLTLYDIQKEERDSLGTTQQVERKTTKVDSGVKLLVTPHVDPLRQIDLNIQLTVSDFSPSLITGTPGSSVSETKTTISLLDGYSALLTGFKGMRKRKIVSRIPLLADIPILGELFKSRTFQDEQTEIMILLTVKASDLSDDQKTLFRVVEKQRTMPDEWVRLNSTSGADLEFSIFD